MGLFITISILLSSRRITNPLVAAWESRTTLAQLLDLTTEDDVYPEHRFTVLAWLWINNGRLSDGACGALIHYLPNVDQSGSFHGEW